MHHVASVYSKLTVCVSFFAVSLQEESLHPELRGRQTAGKAAYQGRKHNTVKERFKFYRIITVLMQNAHTVSPNKNTKRFTAVFPQLQYCCK